VRGAGAGLFIEEQDRNGRRCWVVRDRDGQIIFMCDQPVR
jgi:hypothetical protein